MAMASAAAASAAGFTADDATLVGMVIARQPTSRVSAAERTPSLPGGSTGRVSAVSRRQGGNVSIVSSARKGGSREPPFETLQVR